MNKRFWQITENEERAIIDIYGDITSWKWLDSDVCAYDIKKAINNIKAPLIDVFINSYGGEVAEALAIASALNRHTAKVHTYCDGFACSAATIIFAAGDERTMNELSLLMIHNCMVSIYMGDAKKLTKAAEDSEKINQSSIKAYMNVVNVSEDEIRKMMDDETWLSAAEALEIGFATDIVEIGNTEAAQQSAHRTVFEMLMKARQTENLEEEPDDDIEELIAEVKKLIKLLKEGKENLDGEDGNKAGQYAKAAAFFSALSK